MIQAALRPSRLPVVALTLVAALGLSSFALLSATSEADIKPTGTASAGLTAALDSINPDSIKTDLYFVASDENAGRDTPSAGLRATARFIVARLERLGFEPGAKNGFLYTYPLDQKKLDEEKCQIAWQCEGKSGTWHLGKEYFISGGRSDTRASKLKGKLAFVGKGAKADFDNKALEDKWALCFDANEDTRELGKRARAAKCVGLVIAPGPDYEGKPYSERYAANMERVRDGSVSFPRKGRKGGGGDGASEEQERPGFSTIYLTREAAVDLLAAAKEPATPKIGALIADLSETRVMAKEGQVDCENVCGLWPGSDPVLGKEVILVTAHYDHVGVQNGVVYNGADDNASGTCGLLALAEALTKTGPLRRSVMIMWVSGEEKGLWGSQAWTENPYLPGDRKAICDINIDMIGRNAPSKLLITPTKAKSKEYNGLVRLAEGLAPMEGFPTLGSADEYYTRSDHYNFAKMGLPVMFLFDDVHEDYHQPTDDADKIDFDKIRRVMRLVMRVVDGLQTDKVDIK